MYDTVKLTKNCLPDIHFQWLVDVKSRVNEDGEITQELLNIPINLNMHKGKEYHNGSVGISYSYMVKSLSIDFSLPKLVKGSSIYEISQGDKNISINKLMDTIKPYIQLNFDVMEMGVSRLDNSMNLEMEYPVPSYLSVLNSVLPNRDAKLKKSTYGDTVRMNNKSETIEFYDKVEDCLKVDGKGKIRDGLFPEIKVNNLNQLRYEIQNKNARAISNSERYGERLTFESIWKDEIVDKAYKQRLLTFDRIVPVRENKYPGIKLNPQNYIGDLRSMREINNRAINDFGWLLILKTGAMSINDVRVMMKGAGYTRGAISKAVERLQSLVDSSSKESNLIDEIREKIKNKSCVS